MRHPLRPFEIANYQPRLKWYITSVNDLRCWVTPWSPPSTGFPRSRGKCPKDKGAVIPQEEQGDARSASNARPAYPLCLTAFPPRAGKTMAVWNSTFDRLHPRGGKCPKDKGAVIPREEWRNVCGASNAWDVPLCLTTFPTIGGNQNRAATDGIPRKQGNPERGWRSVELPQFRVETVSQPVPEEVHRHDQQEDRQSGEE